MYLKQLSINGFKSFATSSKLEFTTAISGIVGPNGSGKSNVAEAFRFVLGEQSLKNMRGKKGEDLIFMGSAGKAQRGVVEVVFDNKSKTLDIEYDEVRIERTVSRDGSNEYKINGSKVRAKDISELLSAANIGASGHHIISQGEADKILSINPKERKVVIEEALGLKAFALKKTEAERKLVKTEENLKDVKTEQRTLQPRINYLKREVEKVEKARDMKAELRKLYVQYFPQKQPLQQEREQLLVNIKEKKQVLDQIGAKVADLQKQFEQAQDETHIASQAEKLVAVEKDLQFKKQALAGLERTLGKLDAQIEYAGIEKRRHEEFERAQESHSSLQEVAVKLHNMWRIWAQRLLSGDALTEKGKQEISAQLEVKQVPEAGMAMYRSQAQEIIALVEEREHIAPPTFDASKLERLEGERSGIVEEISAMQEKISEREKERDELDDAKDASETVGQRIQIKILTVEKEKSVVLGEKNTLELQVSGLDQKIHAFTQEEASLRSIFGEEADLILKERSGEEPEMNHRDKIMRLKVLLENSSTSMSQEIENEYQKLIEHKKFVDEQVEDLQKTSESLSSLIDELADEIDVRFREGLEKINLAFAKFFDSLFSGGRAEIFVTDIPIRRESEDDPQEYEVGVDLSVSLPNKKIRGMSMLSGGERSLTSIALLFAMSSVTPPPFIILDETDAALDEANSKRYGDMIELLARESQLILITHNRETMSRAGILYGVTMGQDGASRLLSISLEQAEKVAK